MTGAGWTGGPPAGVERGDAQGQLVGDTIRFMWDYGVDVPLWDERGLVPDEPAVLRDVLGLDDALADDLRAWGRAMQDLDADPRRGTPKAYRDLDRQAKKLAARVGEAVGPGFTVTYVSW